MTRPFLCFIHLEKCGGNTLHRLIQHNLPGYVTLRSWEYWSNKPGSHFSSGDLVRLRRFVPFLSAIGGHRTRTYAGYEEVVGDRIRYMTFLREPLSRYLSHFNYQRQVMGIDWTLDDFLSDSRFDDYQTTRLSRTADVSEAKAVLDEKMAFVGLLEAYDASLLMLKARLPELFKDVRYEARNVAEGRGPRLSMKELNTAQRARVEANNAKDIELYDHSCSGPFAAQRATYPGDLEEDLSAFLAANRDFTYPRARAAGLFVLRNAIRLGVQRPLRWMERRR